MRVVRRVNERSNLAAATRKAEASMSVAWHGSASKFIEADSFSFQVSAGRAAIVHAKFFDSPANGC